VLTIRNVLEAYLAIMSVWILWDIRSLNSKSRFRLLVSKGDAEMIALVLAGAYLAPILWLVRFGFRQNWRLRQSLRPTVYLSLGDKRQYN
jgi:hypothetical protein